MRGAGAIAALALIAAAPGPDWRPVMHAAGTFTVEITPEADAAAPAGGLPTARMGIAKTFSGGLVGTATGTMLSAGAPGQGRAAAYVAVDQFRGTLDGRAGGFLLLHRGTIDRSSASDLSVVIAPGTGSGALEGIAGTLAITVADGVHRYDLTYTLPSES